MKAFKIFFFAALLIIIGGMIYLGLNDFSPDAETVNVKISSDKLAQ